MGGKQIWKCLAVEIQFEVKMYFDSYASSIDRWGDTKILVLATVDTILVHFYIWGILNQQTQTIWEWLTVST